MNLILNRVLEKKTSTMTLNSTGDRKMTKNGKEFFQSTQVELPFIQKIIFSFFVI